MTECERDSLDYERRRGFFLECHCDVARGLCGCEDDGSVSHLGDVHWRREWLRPAPLDQHRVLRGGER